MSRLAALPWLAILPAIRRANVDLGHICVSNPANDADRADMPRCWPGARRCAGCGGSRACSNIGARLVQTSPRRPPAAMARPAATPLPPRNRLSRRRGPHRRRDPDDRQQAGRGRTGRARRALSGHHHPHRARMPRQCRHDDDEGRHQGRIIIGPAGGPGKVDVPLRIAVVQEGVKPKTIGRSSPACR